MSPEDDDDEILFKEPTIPESQVYNPHLSLTQPPSQSQPQPRRSRYDRKRQRLGMPQHHEESSSDSSDNDDNDTKNTGAFASLEALLAQQDECEVAQKEKKSEEQQQQQQQQKQKKHPQMLQNENRRQPQAPIRVVAEENDSNNGSIRQHGSTADRKAAVTGPADTTTRSRDTVGAGGNRTDASPPLPPPQQDEQDYHQEGEEEDDPDHSSRSLLDQSRRTMDRWQQKEQRRARNAQGISSVGTKEPPASSSLSSSMSLLPFPQQLARGKTSKKPPPQQPPKKKKKKQNEFVQSDSGMLIPKHWAQPSSQNENTVAHAKQKTKKKERQSKTYEPAKPKRKRPKGASVVPLFHAVKKEATPRSPPSSPERKGREQDRGVISFAPPFAVSLPQEDPVMDDSLPFPGDNCDSDTGNYHDDNDASLNAMPSSPTSHAQEPWWNSPPRTGPRASVPSSPGRGRLSQRYHALRETLRADALRLRHRQNDNKEDPMDPRHTAHSQTDITVLTSPTPWDCGEDSEPEEQTYSCAAGVTILVYLHQHIVRQPNQNGQDKDDHSTGASNIPEGLAWCYMSSTTAQELSLVACAQLRLYNAVVTTATDGTGNGVSSLPYNENDSQSYHWIMATPLVEQIKDNLPLQPALPLHISAALSLEPPPRPQQSN